MGLDGWVIVFKAYDDHLIDKRLNLISYAKFQVMPGEVV